MRDFNRGGDRGFNRSSDRRGGHSFGGRSFGGHSHGGDRGFKKEMFDAICSACGKECKIPFKPKTDKPIFCSECFEQQPSSSRNDSRGSNGSRREGGSSVNNEKIELLNTKMDKIISLLEGVINKKEEKVVTKKAKKEEKEEEVKPAKKTATKKASATKEKTVKKETKKKK